MASLIILIILYRSASLINAADSCDTLRRSVVRVSKCPENEAEWIEAAKRKNCSNLAESCSEPDRFVYHCVLNPYVNETLEVCARGRNILLGRCSEYSILGNLIQESSVDCTTFTKPCPVIYQSTEAYKYQDCYKLVPRPTTSQSTTVLQVLSTTVRIRSTEKIMVSSPSENSTTVENITEGSGNGGNILISVKISLSLIIVIVVLILLVLWKRRHKQRREVKSNENPMDLEVCFQNFHDRNVSEQVVKPDYVTEESQALLYPSGGPLNNKINEIQVHQDETHGFPIHEKQPKDRKGLLARLDEHVMKLIEAKSAEDSDVASSKDNDILNLPTNLQDIYDTDAEVTDEHIPLIQDCIQKVVKVKNYFDTGKFKSKKVKPE